MTRYRRGRTWDGLNLFPLTTRAEAWLVDMEGEPVHVWASRRGQPPADAEMPDTAWGWSHVALGDEGALYAVVTGQSVLKLDAASRVVWEAPLHAHHDVSLAADGSVYTLTSELRHVQTGGRRRLVLDNQVVRLDGQGRVRERTSLLDVLLADPALAPAVEKRIAARLAVLEPLGLRRSLERWSQVTASASAARRLLTSRWLAPLEQALSGGPPPPAERSLVTLLEQLPGAPFDVLHGNAARALDRAVPGLGEKGDVLVSVRDLDLLAVVDPRRRRVRWNWGMGRLQRQHDPTVMPNGHLLLFDNRPDVRSSRVVEVAPSSGQIVWSQDGFFSDKQGACQFLPGGNVLVVESQTGRAFEITRAGEVVWEFYNKEEEPGLRPTLRHMVRVGEPARACAASSSLEACGPACDQDRPLA